MMDGLVGEASTAFIQYRHILDGPLVAIEAV